MRQDSECSRKPLFGAPFSRYDSKYKKNKDLPMPDTPSFDEAAAHRYFASHCFNRAWDIMEQSNRTPEDDRLMLLLSHASLYHWQERDDCTPQRLSIGYWQASRIQSLLGDAAQALIQAQTALGYSTGLPPFYLGLCVRGHCACPFARRQYRTWLQMPLRSRNPMPHRSRRRRNATHCVPILPLSGFRFAIPRQTGHYTNCNSPTISNS